MPHSAELIQQHNSDLIEIIEELCQKRDQLQKLIIQEEDEKNRLQHDLRIIAEKLAKVNESLSKKLVIRNSYDEAIAQSQNAYSKILNSTNALLHVIKKDKEQLKNKFIESQKI